MKDVLEFAVNVSKSIFTFVYFALMVVSGTAFAYILLAVLVNSMTHILHFTLPYPGLYAFDSPAMPVLISLLTCVGVTVVFGSIGILFSMHSRLESIERTLKSIEHQRQKRGAE